MTLALAILAALALSQPERYDTVILSSGGVLRGTVVEDVPGADLVLLLPDGTSRKIPRAEIVRVDWAGPPPPPPAYPEPPSPPPPLVPQAPREPGPLELGMWIGAGFPAGTLDAGGLPLSSGFTPQFVLGLEASWRVADPLQLGVYLRLSGGSSRSTLNDQCLAVDGWCDAVGVGVGFFPRWSFAPRGAANPWLQVGGGMEYLSAYSEHAGIDYTGWEVGVWAGVDFRGGPVDLMGIFVGTRWGEFTTGVAYGGLPLTWGGSARHGWIDVGLRCAFWP